MIKISGISFCKALVNFTFGKSRDVAQPGSARRSGRRGRWFESSHPDIARRSFSEGGLR